MCFDPVTLALVGTAAASGLKAYGELEEGKASEAEAKRAAQFAEFNAANERARGAIQSERIAGKYGKLAGTQATAAATSGVDPTKGSAAIIAQETGKNEALDSLSALWNAESAAHAQDVQAVQLRERGRNARRASKIKAGTTLLTGLSGSFKGASGGAGGAVDPISGAS